MRSRKISSTNMSHEDIERAVKDAEKFAKEDRRARAAIRVATAPTITPISRIRPKRAKPRAALHDVFR